MGSRNGEFLREERGGRDARDPTTSARDYVLCFWEEEEDETVFWMPEIDLPCLSRGLKPGEAW